MSKTYPELVTTTEPHGAVATPPAPDPRLVNAAAVLVQWLLEELQGADEPQPDGELLAVSNGG